MSLTITTYPLALSVFNPIHPHHAVFREFTENSFKLAPLRMNLEVNDPRINESWAEAYLDDTGFPIVDWDQALNYRVVRLRTMRVSYLSHSKKVHLIECGLEIDS